MEHHTDLSLSRSRTPQACIADGYRLYMGSFRNLFRRSWPLAVAYALVSGVFTSVFVTLYPQLLVAGIASSMGGAAADAGAALAMRLLLALAVGIVASLLSTAALTSCGLSALADHQASGVIGRPRHWYGQFSLALFGRTLLAMLWTVPFVVVAGVVVVGVSMLATRLLAPIAGLCAVGVAGLVAVLLVLPLGYVFMRYLLGSGGFMSHLAASYGAGLRRLGAFVAVAAVTTIVIALLTLLTQLPANVLYMANIQSQTGALQGDPLGMPAYMGWMNLVVFAVGGFIQAYVQLSALFPSYYLYGSLEHDRLEREQELRDDTPNLNHGKKKNTLHRP